MRNKRMLVVVMVALLLLAVSACSPAGDTTKEAATTPSLTGHLDPKKPVTVTLWHYYVGENQQALETAVSDFNQTVGMENGVIVEPIGMGSIAELETNVTNSAMGVINAQPMPQIFSSYPDKALEIDALDQVVDLSGYFTEEEKAQYVTGFLSDGIFGEGRMLLVPVVKSTELLYLNATSWDEFASAEGLTLDALGTWESIYDAARQYYRWTAGSDSGWTGKAMLGFDSVANYIIIASKQMGVNVIDAAAGEAALNKSVLRRVFDPYVEGMGLGYFGAYGKFRSDDIKAGDLIAYVGSSSSAAYFPTWIEKNNTQAAIDFTPLSYPVFDGGEAYAIQQGAGMCVAKSTPAQQEGSVLFLKWFTDVAENIKFAMTTGYLPVKTAAYGSDAFSEALTNLRAGEEAQQNVAGVYEIALHQITESNTYAATPFDGSYDVRSILQSTLMDAAAMAMEAAEPLKAAGLSEEEILEQLDMDGRFDAWIETVQKRLEELEIPVSVQ